MDPSSDEHSGGDWFESEALWARFFSFMFTDAHFTAAVENVPKIVALTGVAGGSVLDLACGPGRFAVAFAQAGFHVTGVDRTRFLLDKARERATQAGATVEWVEQDMREFVRSDAFDLALNVYTSFGYFDDPAENRRVLENILASLKPGGTFLFEHIGKELLAGRFQPTQADTLADGSVMIQRRKVIDDWSRIDVEWIILEGGRATSFRLRHWLYSAREIRNLFASVGFTDIAIYGGLDASPYGPQAQRLVALAKKPRA
jgi:SAM-dependent methyltransferase